MWVCIYEIALEDEGKKLVKLIRFASINGCFILLLEVQGRLRTKLRSWIYCKIFHSRALEIGEHPYFRGTRYIKIGNNLCTGADLWMEAVVRYAGVTHNPQIVIGDDVSMSDNVHITATTSVVLSDGVLVGSKVIITDHNHGMYSGEVQSDPGSRPSTRPLSHGRHVFIGRNVWIGDGVAILPGSTIGDGSIIGANSVVNGYIPPACIAIGSPAHPVRIYDKGNKKWEKWVEVE